MSGEGAPRLHVQGATGLRAAVVAACWHREIADQLLAGAVRGLADCGIAEPTVVRVPGSFELPVVAKRLAESGYGVVVALGVVVRGGTPHFDYVCQAASLGLTQVSVATGVPVGFGLLTCDTLEQARERAGGPGASEDKGHDAALAAVATAVALRELRQGAEHPGAGVS
jgi:6,7-dimethyl-8-ribityllumazine synthase